MDGGSEWSEGGNERRKRRREEGREVSRRESRWQGGLGERNEGKSIMKIRVMSNTLSRYSSDTEHAALQQ